MSVIVCPKTGHACTFTGCITWESRACKSIEEPYYHISKDYAALKGEIELLRRDLAAAEAKLAAKPDVAGLVKECRAASIHASTADKMVANAKSARNIAAGDEGAYYGWLKPEQTLEGRCATALLSLSAQLAEKEAECEGLKVDAERYRWLRNSSIPSVGGLPQRGSTVISDDRVVLHFVYWGEQGGLDQTIDAAIDAAIAARKP